MNINTLTKKKNHTSSVV